MCSMIALDTVIKAMKECGVKEIVEFVTAAFERPAEGWKISEYKERVRAFVKTMQDGIPPCHINQHGIFVYQRTANDVMEVIFKAEHPEQLFMLGHISADLQYVYARDIKDWENLAKAKISQASIAIGRLENQTYE